MREQPASVIETLVGFEVSTLCAHTLRWPPWNTKPELSGNQFGSYWAATGMGASPPPR